MLHKIAHDKTDPRNKQAIQILYKKAGKSMENGDKKKAMQYLDRVTYRPKAWIWLLLLISIMKPEINSWKLEITSTKNLPTK